MKRCMVFFMLALLVGCSAAHPVSVGEIASSDLGTTSRDRVRTGGTLRWPLPDFPTQWNQYQVNGAKGEVSFVIHGLMPWLMRSDERGVAHPDPDYLRQVTLRRHRSGQVVTYTLNPRATWSDGTPITYRDLAAQAAALSGRDHRFQVASTTGYDQISKVTRGVDDQQAVVTFARPFSEWPALFGPLYPAKALRDPQAFNHASQDRLPATAGPFRAGRIDRTAKTVTITRDPRWWGRPAKLDAIVFRVLDLSATPQAFANGEVDLMNIGGDAAAYAQARSVPGAVVRRAGGPDWRQLTLNAGGPLLSDLRVRRAVVLGIDRAALARADLKGLDWPVRPLGNHFYVATQAGYHDNSGNLGVYRPDRAEALLDAAGWRRAGGLRRNHGRELALRMVISTASATARQEAELTQAMLRRIGIRVDIKAVPTQDLFDRYIVPGDFDLAPFSWLGTPYPLSSEQSIFVMPHGADIRQNYARAGSPQIDTLLAQAVAAPDPATETSLTNEADRLIWQQAGVLPLYQLPQVVAVRPGLVNIGAPGFADTPYENIGFATRA